MNEESLEQLAIEQSRIIAALVRDNGGYITGVTWDDVHASQGMVPYTVSVVGDRVKVEVRREGH